MSSRSRQGTNQSVLVRLALAMGFLSLIGCIFLASVVFTGPAKVAYVRTDELMAKYKGMTEAKDQYQVKAASWQANVDTLKKEFELTVKSYETEKEKLSKTSRQEKEKELQSKQTELYRYTQAVGQKAEQEDQKLTEGVLNQVNAFLESYGKKQGYTMIFGANGTGNIIYGNEAKDITSEVLLALNQDYAGF